MILVKDAARIYGQVTSIASAGDIVDFAAIPSIFAVDESMLVTSFVIKAQNYQFFVGLVVYPHHFCEY